MTRVIDLRSDTVTRPSPEMRRAMAAADVGDDVFRDDPTVNGLESRAASLMGKEAALFVPSGTMGNLLAVMTHASPGDEIILGHESHIAHYELGGAARIAGALTRMVTNREDGSLDPDEVAAAIRAEDGNSPGTRLLCLENTQNRCRGAVLGIEQVDELAGIAHERALAVHLDGARIFNASVVLGVPPGRIAREADSVLFCLSKGLGCPVGSLLCGSEAFIARARRNRKLLGGGMRQAGVLAAAGLYALDHNTGRLATDHENAARLAAGIATLGPFRTPVPQTNIVVVDVLEGDVAAWVSRFAAEGVLAVPFGPGRLRMVTHLDVSATDIDETLVRLKRATGA